MIGKTISHYKLTEKLGEGGMGEVYLANDLKLERQVAIKFLPEHLTKDKENVERFEREAKAAAALNHPNIITIYDVIETDGQICIVMEYVDGESLRSKLDKGKVDNDEVIDITKQICEGLEKAHQADIVHRDIKPENILINADNRVKILDFGLAKLKGVSKLTKETSTLGTIHYMSPEQLQGHEIDHRSDIWALGVLVYELLTGEVPFKGEYESAVSYAILNEKPEFLKEIQHRYKFNVGKLLEKEADRRPDSCKEILKELHSIRGTKPKRNKRRLVSIIYSTVSLFFILITGYFLFFVPQDEKITINSLAVLPLENLSQNPDKEYFVDGITDVLISELAQISAIKVISRTSVMQYKGVHKSLKKIAGELDVDAIVEGTVYSDGQKVRITTQLIRAFDDRHLWAEKYEYDLKDIFNLQSDVAQAIAAAVRVQLTDNERRRLGSARQVNPDIYQLYLKGRYHWHERTDEGILKAVDYFRQAIEQDPDYASAYAGLADCYTIQPAYYLALPHDAYPKARIAALKALEIDDQLAEAYTSVAAVRHNYDWAWSEAEELYQKSIALNPNYATAHHWYAELLSQSGRFAEAFVELNRAYELDPLSPVINVMRANINSYGGDYEKAISAFRKPLQLHPDFIFTHYYLALTHSYLQQHQQALQFMRQVLILSKSPNYRAFSGYIYARAGNRQRAIQIRDSLMTLPRATLLQYAGSISHLYNALGEKDNAFDWLEKACEQREYDFIHLKIDPIYDPLRSDPRFKQLLHKLGFQE